jgi:molecular chaperone HscC
LQRTASPCAAGLDGLSVERMVNEPTAAALTYGFHRREGNRRLVVFDLAGGTFEVTVICDSAGSRAPSTGSTPP